MLICVVFTVEVDTTIVLIYRWENLYRFKTYDSLALSIGIELLFILAINLER